MISPGQYTAWTYRRKLLHELGKDLGYEIMWLSQIGLAFEKNYQIWHHRRCIFEIWARSAYEKSKAEGKNEGQAAGKDGEDKAAAKPIRTYIKDLLDNELLYMDHIFDSDSKNYHGWSHIIWLVERYELWDDIRHLEFLEDLLDKDVNNNSVWSFRYYTTMRRNQGHFSKAIVNMELRYVIGTRLPQDWRNEAAWSYLRGFLATTKLEAARSLTTNAKRCFIGGFAWMDKILADWAKVAEYPSFHALLRDRPELEAAATAAKAAGEGVDEHLASIALLQMQYDGLKANRFLYQTIADLAIAKNDLEQAVGVLERLQGFDPIR